MRKLLLSIFTLLITLASQSQGTLQWDQIADYGSFGRHRAVGIGIAHKMYCGTGHLNGSGVDSWYADWWEYDPASNTWTQKSDYPGNFGNGDQDCVAIGVDNVCFVGLGQNDQHSFYKFEPQTNQWTQVTAPPVSYSFNNTFPFTIDGIGYFPALYSTAFFKYDPALDQWTQLNSLPFSTIYGIPTFAINDKGYIKNGTDFYEYKPSLDSWTPRASFPGSYPHRPAGIHQYGYGFFIGGFMGSPSALPWEWAPEVWRYDPATDTWQQMDDFPGTTRRWAVATNVDDMVFYGLGTNGTNFHDFWRFDSEASVNELDEDHFRAYPSPATDHVKFTADLNNEFEVMVYDISGKQVSSCNSLNGTAYLERGNLINGTYLYHITIDGDVVHSGKLIFM